MKKPAADRATASGEDLLPEYEFDYRNSRPNRFARQFEGQKVAIVLEPDVAAVFPTSESVNTLLRSIISALPGTSSSSRPRRRGARSNQG